uniref:Uncharacterized protein n=1 Tax=Castor canadensis TaxID=51338 RepID=A0A8C0WSB5_CASCN
MHCASHLSHQEDQAKLRKTPLLKVCQDKFNVELRDSPGNFVKTEETLFKIQGLSAIQSLKTTDKTKCSNLVNTCIRTTLNRDSCLPPGDHNALYVNTFPFQDLSEVPFPSLDSPGIRGPQKPLWKPFPNQDSDLVVPSGTDSELHIPYLEYVNSVNPGLLASGGRGAPSQDTGDCGVR